MIFQVSFFGHLVPIGLVSEESYLATLRSFISVLEELGGGGRRAEKVIRVVTEGLLRVSQIVKSFFSTHITSRTELSARMAGWTSILRIK